MANVVGERYQITIDKAARAELGLKPGDLAVRDRAWDMRTAEIMEVLHADSERHRDG